MNKKLLIVFCSVLLMAVVYGFTSKREPELATERPATAEEAAIAVDFTKYISTFAKGQPPQRFHQRFAEIPPEDQSFILDTLKEMPTPEKPERVTVPKTESSRRFVYYRDSDRAVYRFAVNNQNGRWLFHGLQKLTAE